MENNNLGINRTSANISCVEIASKETGVNTNTQIQAINADSKKTVHTGPNVGLNIMKCVTSIRIVRSKTAN